MQLEECGLVEIDHLNNWVWVSDLALCDSKQLNQLIKDLLVAKEKMGW